MKKTLTEIVSPNIKALVVPIVILLVLIILSVISYKIAFLKLTAQREEFTSAKNAEKVLVNKEAVLSQIQGDVSSYVDAVVLAVPSQNPAIAMISQLKILALNKSVTLSSIKGGSESTTQASLMSADITLGIEGPSVAIIDYLKAINTLAPLSTLNRVKINQSVGSARAEAVIRTYFSAFPTKLPAMTEPIKELTAEEKEILSKLSQLTVPSFINLTPQTPVMRESPFD
jgi:Tfp pilus assembly protein PilO